MNINFTCEAARHIAKLLNESPLSVGFRVGIKKTGCSGFAYDVSLPEALREGDQRYRFADLWVIINEADKSIIDGLTVDFKVEKLKTELLFINPNESARCGCGESFIL